MSLCCVKLFSLLSPAIRVSERDTQKESVRPHYHESEYSGNLSVVVLTMTDLESGGSFTDRLEERAASAFSKLESILQSHELRLASEKARREELEALELRIKDLRAELGSLLSSLNSGWETEMRNRYEELVERQNRIHDNIREQQRQLDALQNEDE